MADTITYHRCLKCNESMEPYSISLPVRSWFDPQLQKEILTQPLVEIGYICMKEGCERYGLLTITAKTEYIQEGG